jgi:hypothetical protein
MPSACLHHIDHDTVHHQPVLLDSSTIYHGRPCKLVFWLKRGSHVASVNHRPLHQGREFIANGALENGAFCTVFSENFHKF